MTHLHASEMRTFHWHGDIPCLNDSGDPRLCLKVAKAEYARQYGPRRRPWWWWVAYAALMVGGFWVCWRAFAGWPVGASLLQRLAG